MSAIDDEVVAVWIARETGVLAALLDRADTPAGAATEAGVPERVARILARSLADAGLFERVDGTAVFVDRVRGHGEAVGAALSALAGTASGEVHPPAAYREWFADAGFERPSVVDVPGTDRQAVVGSLRE